jgi:Bacterial SH3 domain
MLILKSIKLLLLIFIASSVAMILTVIIDQSGSTTRAQIPTVAIPTVTGTPEGPTVTVRRDIDQDSINVRSGPSTKYDIIGVLIIDQTAPALGRTPGGDWIQIFYPGVPGSIGWIYSPYVDPHGNIPIVEPPPTPTPRITPTIDPTLAAQFIVEIPPTRLPTFTPPPAISIPTYPVGGTTQGTGGVPMGIVVIGMAVLGFFGMIISFLRGR